MEPKSGNKIKLGVFVSISIAIFIIAIYFIGKRQQLFNTTFGVSCVFKDISGLQVGNNVRFCGINVGIIDNIQLVTDSTVRVDMQIDEHVRKFMKKNVKAQVGSDGLMGSKILIIVPGPASNQVLANHDVIQTAQLVSLEEIMVKVKVTSDNMADITTDFSVIMRNIRRGKGTIGKLFMDTAFAENVDRTIVNLKQGAGGFKQNMDAASHSFLLRGYLKKKDKDKEKLKEAKEDAKQVKEKADQDVKKAKEDAKREKKALREEEKRLKKEMTE